MQFRNEIGGGKIDKGTGGKRKNVGYQPFYQFTAYQKNRGSEDHRERREKIEPESPYFFVPGVEQDAKVPYLLRNFVERNRKRRRDAHLNTHQKTRANYNTVYKIVDSV